MNERRKQTGFSLIEVVVAAALFSVILTLVVEIFIPALRAWTDGQKRAEVSQGLLVTSSWISDDVVRSAPGSLELTPEGGLKMKCALGQTGDHTNPFSELVVYWRADDQLFRSTRTLDDPNAPIPGLSQADIEALPEKRRVASGVTGFEVTIPQPWRVGLFLAVEKLGRSGEIRTSFSSIYAPFDLKYAEVSPTPPAP